MSENEKVQAIVDNIPSVPAKQITIDGITYHLDELTDAAKQQLGNLRAVDAELSDLQRKRAIASVARTAYVNALAGEMPKEVTPPKDGGRSAVVDGVSHDWDSLGERVQGLLTGIRAADQELERNNGLVQMAQTARGAFAGAVKQNLPKKDAATPETL